MVRKTKEEKEAISVLKSQHANYKWIKYMFARMDELIVKLKELEKTVKDIREEIQIMKQQLGERDGEKTIKEK